MKVAIIGAEGNMGKRYGSILNSLGVEYKGFEIGDKPYYETFTHIIVATPTNCHIKDLDDIIVAAHDKRTINVLCEKPIHSSVKDRCLEYTLKRYEKSKCNLYMVNQYAYYAQDIYYSDGQTVYDFYNSGKDSILWDCIQLIYLAKGAIKLANNSPVWDCKINGIKLDRESIDLCYMKMIKDFISYGKEYDKLWGISDIRKAHKIVGKVWQDQGLSNRNSGEIHIYKITE